MSQCIENLTNLSGTSLRDKTFLNYVKQPGNVDKSNRIICISRRKLHYCFTRKEKVEDVFSSFF